MNPSCRDCAVAALHERSGGSCEVCGCVAETVDPSHRLAASLGGAWSLANLVHTCRLCHDVVHANPLAAHRAGLMLAPGADPELVPVWLQPRAFGDVGAWWLLTDTEPDITWLGRRHAVPEFWSLTRRRHGLEVPCPRPGTRSSTPTWAGTSA